MFRKNLIEILRWGLRFHGLGHIVEVVAAISEQAYITATIAAIFIFIEILASFYLPKEHNHIKSNINQNHSK